MGQLNNNQSASEYIHWCADMANKQNVGVPWIMCQQDSDVPHNVVIMTFNLFKIMYNVCMCLNSFIDCLKFMPLFLFPINLGEHLQRILLP